MLDAVEIEKAGIPSVPVVGSEFARAAKTKAETMGMKQLPMVVVPSPMGPTELAHQKAAHALAEIAALAMAKAETRAPAQ